MFKDTDYIENEIAVDGEVAIEQTVSTITCCNQDDCNPPTTPNRCHCCCTDDGTVNFQRCDDFETINPTAELLCTGRLLTVNVTVNGCRGRKVIVGVLICSNESTPRALRFKVCEDTIPSGADPCGSQTFTFCFIFKNNLCTETLSLKVKTFAEYVEGFGFPCISC